MKACDICKKETVLISLYEQYQTNEVKEVCYDCEDVLRSHLSNIQEVVGKIQRSWMKRFIDNFWRKSNE